MKSNIISGDLGMNDAVGGDKMVVVVVISISLYAVYYSLNPTPTMNQSMMFNTIIMIKAV